MAYQKGAFQVSMGFIIAVVFAVIMLTLAITWIQGVFTSLSPVTQQVTDVARQNLLNQLSESGSKVGLATPGVLEWKPGTTGTIAVGIRNDDPQNSLRATVKVYLYDPVEKATEVVDWIKPIPTVLVPAGESKSQDIGIDPPAGATKDVYTFVVMVCSSSQGCTTVENTPEDILYGSDSFILKIV